MTTLEILTSARALVARGWCQEHYSVGKNGERVKPESRSAVKWCALGSIHASCKKPTEQRRVAINMITPSIVVFNDAPGRTQAEVVAAFTAAIELARKEQTK